MGNRGNCSTLQSAPIDLVFFFMKGEGLYFSGKRDRAPVSEPFRREKPLKIFVTYTFVDWVDLPGERDVLTTVMKKELAKNIPLS